jgi:excinuclease UvrABC ATPase subunit
MSLEEELVDNILELGKTPKDVLETCKDLVSEGILNLNPKKVDVALERYKLIQKYNSQNNTKKAIKERTNKKFSFIQKRIIENFMEDSSITKSWLIEGGREKYVCSECNKRELKEYVIRYKQIKEKEGVLIPIEEQVSGCINFCFNCGTYSPNQTRQGI